MALSAAREEAASGASSRLAIFSALGLRDFRLLWAGQAISLIGDQFYYVALAWLTLQLTNSAVALGGVLTAAAIPRGVLMLLGGAVSDRFSPRQLMLASDALRAIVVGIQASLVLAGDAHLWQLYVLAVIFGVVDAVFYPSSGAMTPILVDEERRPSAAALEEISTRGALFLGPVAAGILIATTGRTLGDGVAFALDAVSFVASACALFFIRGGIRVARTSSEAEEDGASGLLTSVVDGLRYAWRDPVIRALLVVIAGLDVTLNGAVGVGLPTLARAHFSIGAAALGTMDSAFGLGALVGVAVAGSIARPRRRGLLLAGVSAGFGVGTLLIPFMPGLPLVTLCIGTMAVGSGLINVVLVPWLQTRTDPAMFGRVTSLMMLASLGLTPLAYAAAGPIAGWNVTGLFVIAGAIVLATALYALASRPVRTID